MNINELNPELVDMCNTIIRFNTLPQQIDYISPAMKTKYRNAEKRLEELDAIPQEICRNYIQDAIDEYYGPSGAAQFDDMF